MSDCGAVAGNPAGAIASLEAGTDLECNPWGGGVYPSLVNSSKAGNVSTGAIAQAAERLLYVRFRLGAFDKDVPFGDKTRYGKSADMSEYEKLSLEAGQQSMVLLNNDRILWNHIVMMESHCHDGITLFCNSRCFSRTMVSCL